MPIIFNLLVFRFIVNPFSQIHFLNILWGQHMTGPDSL